MNQKEHQPQRQEKTHTGGRIDQLPLHRFSADKFINIGPVEGLQRIPGPKPCAVGVHKAGAARCQKDKKLFHSQPPLLPQHHTGEQKSDIPNRPQKKPRRDQRKQPRSAVPLSLPEKQKGADEEQRSRTGAAAQYRPLRHDRRQYHQNPVSSKALPSASGIAADQHGGRQAQIPFRKQAGPVRNSRLKRSPQQIPGSRDADGQKPFQKIKPQASQPEPAEQNTAKQIVYSHPGILPSSRRSSSRRSSSQAGK